MREVVRKNLNEIGRKTSIQSKRNSKIAKSKKNFTGGSLRDSGNFQVKPWNVLVLAENFYGKYNTPKRVKTPSDRYNIKNTPLLNSIEENVPDGITVMIKDITDLLIAPIIK